MNRHQAIAFKQLKKEIKNITKRINDEIYGDTVDYKSINYDISKMGELIAIMQRKSIEIAKNKTIKY